MATKGKTGTEKIARNKKRAIAAMERRRLEGKSDYRPIPLPELEGYYASADGTIWSRWTAGRYPMQTDDLHPLTPHIADARPTVRVMKRREGKSYCFRVAKLVLAAFSDEVGRYVDYIDNDPTNCSLENLRWTDRQKRYV